MAKDSYSRDFPETRRIGTSLYPVKLNGNAVTMVPRSSLNRKDQLAFDAHVNAHLDSTDDYLAMFPDTAKIGILG